jgi:CubicO group peptidase (beta-lactamase class C family)
LEIRALTARTLPAVVICVALVLTGCSASRPASTADPLPAAIAAELNSRAAEDHIRAILVDVDGRPRFEHYYRSTAAASRSSASVTKTVMSTLVGIAIGEGRLRLNERLSQMLPRYAAVMTPTVARVTLRQLLTMTAGFPDDWSDGGNVDAPLEASPNWTRFILTHQVGPPGGEFHYSNYGAHLLSPILAQATGRSVLAYAEDKLFRPLGIVTTPRVEPRYDLSNLAAYHQYQRAGFAWPVDPQGFNTGAHSIKLRPRDMAALGQLFLQNGRWRNQQLVPTSWVRQATTAQAGTSFTEPAQGAFNPTNYGYCWWVETADDAPAAYAWGFGGQLIEIVPSRHLIIVVSTDHDITDPHAPTVGPDDIQHLVDVIVPLTKTRSGK